MENSRGRVVVDGLPEGSIQKKMENCRMFQGVMLKSTGNLGGVVDINMGYNFFPEEPNSLIIFHVKTGVRVRR